MQHIAPAITYIGASCNMQNLINWYEISLCMWLCPRVSHIQYLFYIWNFLLLPIVSPIVWHPCPQWPFLSPLIPWCDRYLDPLPLPVLSGGRSLGGGLLLGHRHRQRCCEQPTPLKLLPAETPCRPFPSPKRSKCSFIANMRQPRGTLTSLVVGRASVSAWNLPSATPPLLIPILFPWTPPQLSTLHALIPPPPNFSSIQQFNQFQMLLSSPPRCQSCPAPTSWKARCPSLFPPPFSPLLTYLACACRVNKNPPTLTCVLVRVRVLSHIIVS